MWWKNLIFDIGVGILNKVIDHAASHILKEKPRKKAIAMNDKLAKALYGENSTNGKGRTKW